MSRGLKIGLAVGGGLLLLCCIAGVIIYFTVVRTIQQAVVLDPVAAAKVGHEIVDYRLPDGYQETAAMTILGMKMVIIGPQSQASGQMGLVLAQLPTGTGNQEQWQQQMQQSWEQQGGQSSQNYHVVGTEQVTIRGQSVTLTVSEGQSTNGTVTRQVFGVFTNKGGNMVMLMAAGDKESWNQQALDQFLGSIQ
jgi:hypothetical protein